MMKGHHEEVARAVQEAWRETTEEIYGCSEGRHKVGGCERRGCRELEGEMEPDDWLPREKEQQFTTEPLAGGGRGEWVEAMR